MGQPWSRRQFLGGAGALAALVAAEACSSSSPSSSGTTTRPAPATTAPTTTVGQLPPRSTWRRPDSRPDPTRPAGVDMVPEIDHIVVVMQENHSFDNYFGMLGRGDGFTLDRAGRPINWNPYHGKFLQVYHETDTCQPGGVDQSWDTSHLQYRNGTNQGFAEANGGAASMGYFDRDEIPFYWSLGSTYPICDRYFCSVMGQTYPNRRFMMAGTAFGLVNSDLSSIGEKPPNGTIFDRLNHYGISWKNYKSELATTFIIADIPEGNPTKIVGIDQFHRDARAGTLPSVSFVDSNNFSGDEENPQDIQIGEAFVADVVRSVTAGPAWAKTMLIWTYDEHGGWYDHVPPPPAIPPDDILPKIQLPRDQPGKYDRYGFRVPTAIVSARSRKDHVSHTIYDHTSILKTIERKWNLPALTFRDANAHDLFDCLDLVGPPAFADPPTLAAAANTTGVSACAAKLNGPNPPTVTLPPASAIVDKPPT
jgi:phospholipase C